MDVFPVCHKGNNALARIVSPVGKSQDKENPETQLLDREQRQEDYPATQVENATGSASISCSCLTDGTGFFRYSTLQVGVSPLDTFQQSCRVPISDYSSEDTSHKPLREERTITNMGKDGEHSSQIGFDAKIPHMVFGVFVDVPLLTLTFVAMFRFRKRLTSALVKVRVPLLATYLISSVPLIIFEEQIDCQPSWCGSVLVPPTLPFLVVEMSVLGVLVLRLHARSLLRVTLVFSIYGVLFEIFLGGLMGAPVIVVALLAPYVALGYAFISMLPLNILLAGKGTAEKSAGPISEALPSDPTV